jgi:hypothetical protein
VGDLVLIRGLAVVGLKSLGRKFVDCRELLVLFLGEFRSVLVFVVKIGTAFLLDVAVDQLLVRLTPICKALASCLCRSGKVILPQWCKLGKVPLKSL